MIFKRACGAVRYGATYCPAFSCYRGGKCVVYVIFAVGCKTHVRRVHTAPTLIIRVVGFFPYNALVPPLFKVVDGRRPRYIIVHTERFAVKFIVRAVNVNSVAENVRLAIGNIFEIRQIGVKYLLAHFSPLVLL